MTKEQIIQSALDEFGRKRHELEIFMSGVSQWFQMHPQLTQQKFPIIHSVKSRLKDANHLEEKIRRKWSDSDPISNGNIFEKITDLAGVRVLHIHQAQFAFIHEQILDKVDNLKDWFLAEPPKAYTWDPESKKFFESFSIDVHMKESFYTSIHYLVKPREDSPLCCEIQVRTLFEEIWGEVDHAINYPNPTSNVHCSEQLLVLAKVVGAGSRLVDSIFKSVEADIKN